MRNFSYITAMAILVGSGIIHKIWSDRLESSWVLDSKIAQFDRVPLIVGKWSGESSFLTPRMINVAKLDGYLFRRYMNPQGDVVTVLLVLGRPGPISVHTPEACYAGIGYLPTSSKAERLAIAEKAEGRHDDFWVLDMMKAGVTEDSKLRIFYAWTTDGWWKAADNPRYEFADSVSLFKMYFVCDTSVSGIQLDNDPIVNFAADFIPELRRTIFASPSG